MGLMSNYFAWLRPEVPGGGIETEASRLVQVWGEEAYAVASDLCWRQEAGLLQTKTPGFWLRVAKEVAHQLGLPEQAALSADLLAG